MAKKKSAAKKTATKKRAAVRKNDPLRKKLEQVMNTIDAAPQATQNFNEVQSVRNALPLAIQKLKDNPGPVQTGHG